MALDSIFLRALTSELSQNLVGAKIEKVLQPARGSLVFGIKADKRVNLFIGGSSGSARINLTNRDFEKPEEPPMFCMLLRKHLVGARIISVTQPDFERVVVFRLAAPGMFGEGEERSLIVELLGRNTNVILTDGEGIITDCLYRIGAIGEKRMVLPGMMYRLPPKQDKRSLSETDGEGMLSAINEHDEQEQLDKLLVGSFLGISPLVARELCLGAYGEVSPRLFEAKARDNCDGIVKALLTLSELISNNGQRPYAILSPDGSPFDISYIPITQYGADYKLHEYDSFSELLEGFSGRRDDEERRRQRSRELTRTIKSCRDRVARRIAVQESELKKTENREQLRECGDIITSNIHAMHKGMSLLRAFDYYSPDGGEREIPLDPLKSPQENAAKYYKDYTKAKSAGVHLQEQLKKGRAELDYLDSVLDELERAENVKDLTEIRAELISGGYVRQSKSDKRIKRQVSGPMKFVSSSGFEIRVGRNNSQNDELTLKSSAKTDVWLHTQKIHGSHVVISCGGRTPDDVTLTEAASLAALYSQGASSGKVPVDYTLIKFVKKPNGARPGMVIYTDYKTIFAAPDSELAEKLKIK
jgi:predicted ribosome quality control (RQC) complex YloA/Tae2 family protein